MPTRIRCPVTGGRQRGERATSTTAPTTNTSTACPGSTLGGYWGWATSEFTAQWLQQQQGQGGRNASHPADDGNTQAGGMAAFRRQQTEEQEGDVNDDGNDEHVDRHVRGPRRADTGDRQWRRLQCNGDDDDGNDNNDDKGGLHPTPRTMATRELVMRLYSDNFPYGSDAFSSDMDKAKGQ